MVEWYFKLFNNIKSPHESEILARLELEGLFGKVEEVYNFCDELRDGNLSKFANKKIRLQDYLLHELPYGRIQGYKGDGKEISKLISLIKRLAYTREVYVVLDTDSEKGEYEKLKNIIKENFPENVENKIYKIFKNEKYICFRFITYQYFLEKSFYITKLSRNEGEIEQNTEIMFLHLNENIYRIPAAATLSIGKRLEDYFSIREEPSLYLTHYFHPYKGKFHPKMVRALLNYVAPIEHGVVMDNFAGSGTLLVEATLMELDSIGVEINPLSVLMSNVKTQSLKIDVDELRKNIEIFLDSLNEAISNFHLRKKGQTTIFSASKQTIDYEYILRKSEEKRKLLKKDYFNGKPVIEDALIAKKIIIDNFDGPLKDFFLLALSGTISDLSRRTKMDFYEAIEKRLYDLYRRLYLFKKINERLNINVGHSKTYVGDTRDMKFIDSESIDGIVNSPPYSTALDYIKNDFPQLIILELSENISELEKNMMGNPRIKVRNNALQDIINSGEIPDEGLAAIEVLIKWGRENLALRTAKFFIDMKQSLEEMYRVLKENSKCAIIIGNNHFRTGDSELEVPNDKVVVDLAKKIGFSIDKFISRDLHKSSSGYIREESIIILKK